MSQKFPGVIFDVLLKIRQCKKLLSNYLINKGGEDGRIRCSYVIGGTETGRLSSRKSVFNTGMNLQNIPPGVCRRMFIADEGKTFVNVDLSQAEARVVAYIAEEIRQIKVFEDEGDIHQLNADNLPPDFTPKGSAYENVPNPRRLFAKKHVHAFNYGEGAWAFAKEAGIPRLEATAIRNKYFDSYPSIRAYHMGVQSALNKNRVMTTPMGRRRTFFGPWGDQLFREAYAFVPQSTVGDVLNLALIGFCKINKLATPMLQIHDAFLVQCDDNQDMIDRVSADMREAFKIPLSIKGRTFTIPIDIKVGKNWDEMEEVK